MNLYPILHGQAWGAWEYRVYFLQCREWRLQLLPVHPCKSVAFPLASFPEVYSLNARLLDSEGGKFGRAPPFIFLLGQTQGLCVCSELRLIHEETG